MGNASPSIQKWPRWSQIQMIMMGFESLKRNEGYLNWAVCLKTNGPVFSLFDD